MARSVRVIFAASRALQRTNQRKNILGISGAIGTHLGELASGAAGILGCIQISGRQFPIDSVSFVCDGGYHRHRQPTNISAHELHQRF
jgi:hypothetical protein